MDRLYRVFLVVVFVAMAVELFLLSRQNRALEAMLASMKSQVDIARQMSQPPLRAGEIVAPLDLATLDGAPERLAYDDDRTTVLLFFSPNCSTCEENLSNWKRMEESADPRRVRLVYVSTAPAEETEGYAREHGVTAPFVVANYPDLQRYRVFRVPATLVIGKGGVVKNAWVGIVSEEEIAIVGGTRS
jgi:peroxiredoxin